MKGANNLTRLLVLGMLDIKPMSGYDIQQMLKTSHAERWGGVLVGSIYHALKKLEQEKYIEIISIEQTGHRQKAIYQITNEGKDYLKILVTESLQNSSILYPTTLYSGLSFLNIISSADTKKALEKQRLNLENELQIIKQGMKAKNIAMQNNMPTITKMIFEHMSDMIQLQLNFIESSLQLLNSQD